MRAFSFALMGCLVAPFALADSLPIPPAQHGLFDGSTFPSSAQGMATVRSVLQEQGARQSDVLGLNQQLSALKAQLSSLSLEGHSINVTGGSSIIADTLNLNGADKPPIQLYLQRRYDGGAWKSTTLAYPRGITFKYPPHISAKAVIVGQEEWQQGGAANSSDLAIQSVSQNSFTFQHTGSWPGFLKENISFVIEGIPQ